MENRKILFLGESYRADAITWMNGLKEFGNFEIITWELKSSSNSFVNRVFRLSEYLFAMSELKKIIASEKPVMVIAERTTSYGFLAAICGIKIAAIAQQGITDLWPKNSVLYPLKKILQEYAFKKATLIHAWGPVMSDSMKLAGVDMNKVMTMPKGIDLRKFNVSQKTNVNKICAIVTRSLQAEYKHDVIIKAFDIIKQQGYDFELVIIGDGNQMEKLKQLATDLKIADNTTFTGRIDNSKLPLYLQAADFYISMPTTEGVSASLFEAMASSCYPIVTDLPGNSSWIQHRKNGQLVEVNNYKMLADEIIWAHNNREYVEEVVKNNRQFVEQYANYQINMKIIADKYHLLIEQNKTEQDFEEQ